MRKCTKCEQKHYGKGLCKMHYGEVYRGSNRLVLREKANKYYHNNKEALKETKQKITKAWREKNKDKIREQKRNWFIKNKEKVQKYSREYSLKRLYGITSEDYQIMLMAQGGKCKICHSASDTALFVDHNHVTGTIRGLLCTTCNMGIGHFKDDISLLKSAISYLEPVNIIPGELKIE